LPQILVLPPHSVAWSEGTPRVRNGLEALADRLPKRTTKSFGECR